jgi:hypothetical protein
MKAPELGIVGFVLWGAYMLTSSSPCCSSMCVLAHVSRRPMTQRSYSYQKAPCVQSSLREVAVQAQMVA